MASILMPIEFKDCLTDSPEFRKKLQNHEKELDKTNHAIKSLTKEIKNLVEAAKNLSNCQKNLMVRLQSFAQEPNKANLTEDEVVILQSFEYFAQIIKLVEDERRTMLESLEQSIIIKLEDWRKDAIGGAKECRKKFEKQTHKFYQSQERYLNLSTKKDDQVLQEADAYLDMEHRHFVKASLEYVFLLQEVQERKKIEFVELVLRHTYSWLTFYHSGYEVYMDHSSYMADLQLRIQRTRENFNSTRQEAFILKNKMLEIQDPGSMDKMVTRQGCLFLMEKKAFGTTWSKVYCSYKKEKKEFTMMFYSQGQQKTEMQLRSCVRRASDTIDKRFCLDLTVSTIDREKSGQNQVLTLQTLSDEDCKRWMDAMDGKEPVYASAGLCSAREITCLDDNGYNFLKRAISCLESKGLEDQGLYRMVGVSSKVSKLLAIGLDPVKSEKLVMEDKTEWEVKTITSAIKQYFRNLPEPLITYKLHSDFLKAAKKERLKQRVNCIHFLVHNLPKTNFKFLKTLIKHLKNVASKHEKNLMTVSNLGVCFGPTLLRPEEESVAAIMDIKFCNIVIEILIDNFELIFNCSPSNVLESSSSDSALTSSGLTEHTVSSAPKTSPGLPKRPSQSPPYLSNLAASKPNQPLLQTVVTSFTTSEPQTAVHFGSEQDLRSKYQLNQPSPSLSRSDASSDLKKDQGGYLHSQFYSASQSRTPYHAGHHSQHSFHSTLQPLYHSKQPPPVPPPPSITQTWPNSASQFTSSSSITSVHESSLEAGPTKASRSVRYQKPLTSNGRPCGPPLSFINPIATPARERSDSCSSCESTSSRSSARDVVTSPPAPTLSSSSSQSASSTGPRLCTAYPPTYRKHMETRLNVTASNSPLPTLANVCTASFSSFFNEQSITYFKPNGFATPRRRVRTLYACIGENESELSFKPNQILTNVRPSKEPEWLECTLNGRSGLVPENYVEYIDDTSTLPSLISQKNDTNV